MSRAGLKRTFLKRLAVLRLQLVLRPDLEELRGWPWGSGEKAWGLGKHKDPKLILRIYNKNKQTKPPENWSGAREITQQLSACCADTRISSDSWKPISVPSGHG